MYYNPENYGLEVLGDIEWDDEPYQFNMTAVWRHLETGELYMGTDSGCSCPSPFEDYNSLDDLENVTKTQLFKNLRELNESNQTGWSGRDCSDQIARLMERL